MGDRRGQARRVQFHGKIKLSFHRAKITSNAGLLPFRKLDEGVALPAELFAAILDRIQRFGVRPPLMQRG